METVGMKHWPVGWR